MNLADYMQATGLSDEVMGARLGKNRVTISRYRRGVEKIPGDVVKQLVEMDARMTANELLGIHVEAAE